jgi:hypothetical protein
MDLLVSRKAGCDPETDTGMGLLYLKNELKRMFLRVLYGIQYGTARSRMKDCSNNTRCITSTWFKRYWGIDLSGESGTPYGRAERDACCQPDTTR